MVTSKRPGFWSTVAGAVVASLLIGLIVHVAPVGAKLPGSGIKPNPGGGSGSAITSVNTVTSGAVVVAPKDAKFITQTSNSTLTAEQALGDLATGLLWSTTTTGVLTKATSAQVAAAGDAATPSLPGMMSATDKTKLNALPGTWTVVSIPSDTTDVVLSSTLNGDTDGGYEIDYVSAPSSDTSTQVSINVAVDSGGASATGCTSVTTFGNGSVTGSTAQTRLDVLTASSVATSQTSNARIVLEATRTTFPRTFIAFGVRLTPGGTTNIANWWTQGTYQATGNITGLTLHASTSNGIKAGGLLRYRVQNF